MVVESKQAAKVKVKPMAKTNAPIEVNAPIVSKPVAAPVVVSAPVEEKKFLAFKDWLNVELRVGLIEVVEDILGKDKLYKLSVDFASEKRTIVAGLKPYYSKEELGKKKAVFVYNLAPARLGGVESNGMILAARNSDGKYKVFFADDSVAQGTKLE